ncbi:DUF6165 family protein [Azospirillum sp. ST 5-10]|uniref:DUF6165 family protein n=1 Tax=unclassified Azospirillum TaxID=2630922 RepID=UPI003F49CA95
MRPADHGAGNAGTTDIAQALRHHRAGALSEARRLYRAVLGAEPDNADALHLLGVVHLQNGDLGEAETLIRRALARMPSATGFSNLGAALYKQRRTVPAIDAYRNAMVLTPEYAEAYTNIASSLRADGRTGAAATAARRALRLRADLAEARIELATALAAERRYADAIRVHQTILALHPDRDAAHQALGRVRMAAGMAGGATAAFRRALRLGGGTATVFNTLGDAESHLRNFVPAAAAYRNAIVERPADRSAWNNLGVAMKRLERSAEARTAFRRALLLDPFHAEAHSNFGNELRDTRDHADALAAHRRAAALMPGFPTAYNNMGAVLPQEGPAIALYHRALRLRPDYADAHFNLGSALKACGRTAAARGFLERALALSPGYVSALNNLALQQRDAGDAPLATVTQRRSLRVEAANPESHLNLALLLLMQGAFAEGFEEYEWRWRGEALKPAWRPFRQPQWRGEPGGGRTLLVWCEQGLGDTLQFVRYIPMARTLGWRVVLELQGCLQRLVSSLDGGVTMVVQHAPLPPFDAHCPLLSLPRALATTVTTVPAPVPYLRAEEGRRALWRERLPRDGFRVGIVWQGNPAGKIDRGRSYPLACAAPLARVPGVHLVSLQKTHGLGQLERLPPGMTVRTLGAQFDAGGDAFLDSAAVAMELDLIVTSDTAVAHLAGALGRPVWLVLQATPDWRWLQGRDDSPWYPTMRLFRQTAPGDWGTVFARMAAELEAVTAGETARLLPPPAATPLPSAPEPDPQPGSTPVVRVDIAPGELLDKITILEIKLERIADPAKTRNVAVEHELLTRTADAALPKSAELSALVRRLKAINERLWVIEDDIRACERAKDFGETFIALARAVYHTNDERAAVKRAINTLLNSALVEEKSYAAYT